VDTKKQFSLIDAMHYAASITFHSPSKQKDVPAIGIVFGNPEIAANCQSICDEFGIKEIRLTLKADLLIGELILEDIVNNKLLVKATVNIDSGEIKSFLKQTTDEKSCVLAFGFRSGCDFIICPASEKDKYKPIVLYCFDINLSETAE
jgi:hypothetical protein